MCFPQRRTQRRRRHLHCREPFLQTLGPLGRSVTRRHLRDLRQWKGRRGGRHRGQVSGKGSQPSVPQVEVLITYLKPSGKWHAPDTRKPSLSRGDQKHARVAIQLGRQLLEMSLQHCRRLQETCALRGVSGDAIRAYTRVTPHRQQCRVSAQGNGLETKSHSKLRCRGPSSTPKHSRRSPKRICSTQKSSLHSIRTGSRTNCPNSSPKRETGRREFVVMQAGDKYKLAGFAPKVSSFSREKRRSYNPLNIMNKFICSMSFRVFFFTFKIKIVYIKRNTNPNPTNVYSVVVSDIIAVKTKKIL